MGSAWKGQWVETLLGADEKKVLKSDQGGPNWQERKLNGVQI